MPRKPRKTADVAAPRYLKVGDRSLLFAPDRTCCVCGKAYATTLQGSPWLCHQHLVAFVHDTKAFTESWIDSRRAQTGVAGVSVVDAELKLSNAGSPEAWSRCHEGQRGGPLMAESGYNTFPK